MLDVNDRFWPKADIFNCQLPTYGRHASVNHGKCRENASLSFCLIQPAGHQAERASVTERPLRFVRTSIWEHTQIAGARECLSASRGRQRDRISRQRAGDAVCRPPEHLAAKIRAVEVDRDVSRRPIIN